MSSERIDQAPVFLNEGMNEYMRSFAEHNDTGVNIELVDLPLDSAVRKFVEGNYSAWVTGIDATTGDVARSCIKIIGLDKDGLLSSFFAMEKAGEKPFYLGDCALNHDRDSKPEKLLKIADKTIESLLDMGEIPKVAFLASPGEPDSDKGDVISQAAKAFVEKHPDIETIGVKTWKEARELGANTFFFADLDAGNICYKIQNDPDGGDWKPVKSTDSWVKVLEKDGRRRYLSSYPIHTPNAYDLVDATVRAYNEAKARMSEDQYPRVALLSFATEKSALGTHQPEIIEQAKALIQERYPELQMAVEGPLQWDAATDERVFEKKTNREFRGEPDVLIFPTRDSGHIAYDMLQESAGGDRTAVGPIFQGLRDGKRVIDLSRGAREREIEGAVKTGGRSNVALKVMSGGGATQPIPEEKEIAA